MIAEGYIVGHDQDGQRWIHCLCCGMRSYHPRDIAEGYCGNCHDFHLPPA